MIYRYLTCCEDSILCEKEKYVTFKGYNYCKTYFSKSMFIY